MKKTLVLAFVFLSACASGNEVNIDNQMESPRKALENALSVHEGNVVYIDFWASWCVPCIKSFPWMNKIQQKYKEQGFTVVSINLDADKTKADQFLQDNPASFAVIYDNKGAIAKHFAIEAMPTSMIVNREGKITYRHSGFFTGKIQKYEEEIQQLLNSSTMTNSKQ